MRSDDLEFSITQYLGGTLDESGRLALEARLEKDAEARALLDEHRRLDAVLKSQPLPAVRWDALAERISSAVATLEMPETEQVPRVLRMPWVGVPSGWMALAASLLVVGGVGIVLVTRGSGKKTNHVPNSTAQTMAVLEVTGPRVETSSEPSTVEVSVGPSSAIASEPILTRYSDDVITRPSHVMVASGANPVQDADTLPPDME